MIPPVPIESLPQWVQDALKRPVETLSVGDKVFDTLYGKPDGVVLDVGIRDDGSQWCQVGWDLDPASGRYRKMASGANYYVKQEEGK